MEHIPAQVQARARAQAQAQARAQGGQAVRVAQVQGARADSLSYLQNLGRPLSLVDVTTPQDWMPEFSPVPSVLDFSLDGLRTRTKKCCKEPPPIERFSSELYPIPAAVVRDARPVVSQTGLATRYDGRDPVAYKR